jgi:hypothetical protein
MGEPKRRRYRIQFWVKHRGSEDVYLNLFWVNDPSQLTTFARKAVSEALRQFNKRWSGTRREELVLCGVEDLDRGVILHANGMFEEASRG